MSCMQMQMFEELFTVSFVPDRLQCQASTQPPILLLGSASKDVSGLPEPCKFPHPQTYLYFQSTVLLPPSILVGPSSANLCNCLLWFKRLWRSDL